MQIIVIINAGPRLEWGKGKAMKYSMRQGKICDRIDMQGEGNYLKRDATTLVGMDIRWGK